MTRWSIGLLFLVATPTLVGTGHASPISAKNIILLIADGGGYNVHKATELWNGSAATYESAPWTTFPVSTYPLRTGGGPIAGAAGLSQDLNTVYDPAKAWDTAPSGFQHFAGYEWNSQTAPDSANTASNIQTGQKSYNNAVNVNGNGTPLVTFAERAKQIFGKSVGVATTVEWGDATPSINAGAHNVNRGNRAAITDEMLGAGIVDVIMGGGNPDFDTDGNPMAPVYAESGGWISSSTWLALKNGTDPNWELHQDVADFTALANGTLTPVPGKKFLGTFKSIGSTQEDRSGFGVNPYSVPFRTDVPSLSTMVQGSLNLLDDNPNGFFAMFEGGAVDHAEHQNDIGRMIEEQNDFDAAVQTVAAYLDANTNGNNWANTLVIVTADHDHLLLGPDSDTNPFSDLTDNGAGNLPGSMWQSSGHSNRLVPMFVRGPGSELFALYTDQFDAFDDGVYSFGRGAYLDQTEINAVLNSVVPEPASVTLLAVGGLALLCLGRRVNHA